MEGSSMSMLFVSLCLFSPSIVLGGDFNPYMDNLLFNIKWPGAGQAQQQHTGLPVESLTDDNSVIVMTQDKEKYKCVLPVLSDNNSLDDEEYDGPTALELLKPLLTQSTCSYRIESYWTYEMCHGRFLRQYHEEKEPGKKPKLQEYFLGYNKDQATVYHKAYKKDAPNDHSSSTSTSSEPPPDASVEDQIQPPNLQVEEDKAAERKTPLTHKVEGFDMPYAEVILTGGTKCDLTGGYRRTSLRYVCIPDTRGELYELKESSTCEYEVVVMTGLLCSHPDYHPKTDPINQIQCHPIEGSPTRPKGLETLESESQQERYNKKEEKKKTPVQDSTVHYNERKPSKPSSMQPAAEKSLVRDFLNGDFCLQGGHGWWKHEFCYGKRVVQYHESRAAGRVEVLLGVWDEGVHLDWLQKNPNKKPKPLEIRGSVSQYYGSGEICDLTGKPRSAEVKLRCKNDPEQPNAVIIYLTEPKTCEYVLVVESPILCNLISQSDNNGLFKLE